MNLGQSTNDVYPTAIKLALVEHLRLLIASLVRLGESFERKSIEFDDIVKMGRTQLQDAVPMTLGQEFAAYSIMLNEDCARLSEGALLLLESNLGGTAIGTGINGHPEYSALACNYLRELTDEPVVPAGNLIEATQDCGAFVQVSGILKRVAVKLSKTCNDLRLTSSGPTAGLGEINLPPAQAGSSIMPGKVNPVIPEMVNQVAFEVIGNDLTVTMAAEGGQLQLNAFEPVIVYSLLRSTTHLAAASDALAVKCVDGITANRDHLERGCSALDRHRHRALAVHRICRQRGYRQEGPGDRRLRRDLAVDDGLLTRAQVDDILSPPATRRPAHRTHGGPRILRTRRSHRCRRALIDASHPAPRMQDSAVLARVEVHIERKRESDDPHIVGTRRHCPRDTCALLAAGRWLTSGRVRRSRELGGRRGDLRPRGWCCSVLENTSPRCRQTVPRRWGAPGGCASTTSPPRTGPLIWTRSGGSRD